MTKWFPTVEVTFPLQVGLYFKHKMFYKYQFGFRKNHATTNALTEVIDYIYKSLDEGNYVLLTSKKPWILYSMINS